MEDEWTELEANAKAAQIHVGSEWRPESHGSGSTNVHFATGQGFNEHGAGMVFAPITIYNRDAWNAGETEDGAQRLRWDIARFIAAANPEAVLKLIEEVRRLRKTEWGIAHNAGRKIELGVPRWSVVRELTSWGSTSSIQICERHGVDPHEILTAEREPLCSGCGEAIAETEDALRKWEVDDDG